MTDYITRHSMLSDCEHYVAIDDAETGETVNELNWCDRDDGQPWGWNPEYFHPEHKTAMLALNAWLDAMPELQELEQ